MNSKKINNRCSSSISVLVAAHVRFYTDGIQKEATDGCKRQANTGTKLQPGVTVNPPPPRRKQQQPAIFSEHKEKETEITEKVIKVYTSLFFFFSFFFAKGNYEGCPSPWLHSMGERLEVRS